MIGGIFSVFRSVWKRMRFESDMDSEIRDHMSRYEEDLVSRGVPAEEAAMRARREFGQVELIKEECRDSKGLQHWDALCRNVRYGARILQKNPAFALAAILTLGLCIGANTAIFSVVDAILFRPLPYPEPDRLARVSRTVYGPQGENTDLWVDGHTWEFLRVNVRSVEVALHATARGANLVGSSGAEYIRQMRVSAGFFRVVGIAPWRGREIDPQEDRLGGPAVAVLSHELWKRVMNSDPQPIGRAINLRGEPYTVIGVMPEGFNTTPPVDVWTPLRPSIRGEGAGSNYTMIARVRDGQSWDQANAELSSLGVSYVSSPGIRLTPGSSVRFSLMPVQRATALDARVPLAEPLLLLWTAVGLILLIGCVNVAGLMLARGGTRRHEIATRLALGSGRKGILGQLFTETLVLAFCGGAGGLAIGYGLLIGLRKMVAESLELTQPMTIDIRVLGITVLAALLASLLFGLYPAWDASRMDIRTAIASASRTASRRRNAWARSGLVVCEVALGTVLLVSAGLMVRTVAHFTSLDAAYDGRNVIAGSVSLQDARYSTASTVNRLFDESLARIRLAPGVIAAGVGLTLPYERALNDGVAVIDGPEARKDNQVVNITYVTPGYFESLRMKVLNGRFLADTDRASSLRVAVVNEAFVRRFFGDDPPVGRHLSFNKNVEIVGVVGDVPQVGFPNPLAHIPNVYVPASQLTDAYFRLVHTWFTPKWVVRSDGTQAEIVNAISSAIHSVDPQLPIARFETMDQIQSKSIALQRLESALLGSLAALALVLTAVGIYGLIAHSVVERTREFGIRIALGCSVGRAIAGAVGPGFVLAVGGIAIGYVLSRWTSSVLKSIIYGVQLTDGPTYLAVTSLLLLVAALATFVPSLQITRIDPVRTLRDE